MCRACLDQPLITIRSPRRRHDHVQSPDTVTVRDHFKGKPVYPMPHSRSCMHADYRQYLMVIWYACSAIQQSHTRCFTHALTTHIACVQWTDSRRLILNYSILFNTALGGATDHLMMTSRSSITVSSDRGKPYWCSIKKLLTHSLLPFSSPKWPIMCRVGR